MKNKYDKWNTPYDLYEEKRSASSCVDDQVNVQRDGTTPSAGPSSVADTVQVRGISVAGWTIETHRGSIADSKTIDNLSDEWEIPLPEMPFDKNKLIIKHPLTGWVYCFNGMDALRSIEGVQANRKFSGIDMGKDESNQSNHNARVGKSGLGEKPKKRVQVSYANEWGKKRELQDSTTPALRVDSATPPSNFGPEIAVAAASGAISTARDYDWTYSCHWPGRQISPRQQMFSPAKDPALDRIPVERLGPPIPGEKAEPILFFDDLILYEDELGDNGSSMLNVKVRVMPTGLLVLQRFFLRVDNVVFRMFDTRMYIGFQGDAHLAARLSESTPNPPVSPPSLSTSPETVGEVLNLGSSPLRVVRECTGIQARYVDVKGRLPPYKPHDLSLLTDVNWVTQQMTKIDAEKHQPFRSHQGLHPGTMVPSSQIDPTKPAVLPNSSVPGYESNRILGEVDQSEHMEADQWEGEGHRIDVVLLNV